MFGGVDRLDCALATLTFFYVVACPYTKVEESFNLQATHDLLYHRADLSQYDHHDFPGVVPRTFLGPLGLSLLSSPIWTTFRFAFGLQTSKLWALYVVRIVLGLWNCFAVARFRRAIDSTFGKDVGAAFTMISCTQFHLLFYMSRTLPNVFAFGLVMFGFASMLEDRRDRAIGFFVAAIIFFRCDVAILLFSILLVDLLSVAFAGKNVASIMNWFWRTLRTGLSCTCIALTLTVVTDSYFWRRWLWPEGEVFYFNTILNKSSEWGVMPKHWYFSSALPRSLLSSYILFPLGVLDGFTCCRFKRSMALFVLPSILFVCLYSLLPHKELRFIFYAIPVFNVSAASGMVKIYRKVCVKQEDGVAGKDCWHLAKKVFGLCLLLGCLLGNVCASSIFFGASYRNYPGGEGLTWLHNHRSRSPGSVHIDVHSAMTGVSRFVGVNGWTYSKVEHLKDPGQFAQFDYVLTESPTFFDGYFERIHTVHEFTSLDVMAAVRNRRVRMNEVFKTKPSVHIMKRLRHTRL